MIEVPIDVLPPVIWEMYKEVFDRTEVEPVVYRNGFGCMILTHGNDRVRVTVKFKNNTTHWDWHSSTLTIDGKKVPTSTGPDHYAAIFNDPDSGRYDFTPDNARKANLPKMRDLDEEQLAYLPKQVAATFEPIRKAVTDPSTTVSVRVAENDEYVVCIEHPEKLSIYMFLANFGGSWYLSRNAVVNRSGYEVGFRYDGGIDDIILDILGVVSRKAQQSFTPESAPRSHAGMSNSVAVRKSTVFRI